MVHKKVGVMAMFSIGVKKILVQVGLELNAESADNISLNQGVGKLPLIPCTRADPSEVMEDVETCDRSMNLVLWSSNQYLAI